jgi:hypothetical protein
VLFFGSVAPAGEVKADKPECVKAEASKDCGKSDECSRRKPVKKLIASLKEKCRAKCRKADKCCKVKCAKKKLVVKKVYKRYRFCKPFVAKRICCG